MATQYTPQEIEAWKLEQDYRRLDRGEAVATIGSTLMDEPVTSPHDGKLPVGPGSYRRKIHKY